ncbi:MAG: solute carrier family 23 protein, partial [Pseudomonadota bacterium]|nr:solute carrier family 23 protein [Pseudomonadota bacterium]
MPEDREVVGPSLIFGLNDRPDPAKTFLAAAAHLFAIVASILTAPLLIARAVGLDSEATQYVISASLVVSGIATFIQTFRIGIVGSGLLAVQGTSFAFIGTMAYAASQLPPTTSQEELLGVLLGTAAVGGGMIVFLSFFLDTVRRVITPTVTGVTICLLGLSLLWSALGNSWRLLSMASDNELLPLTFEWLFTLGIITLLATRNNPYARLVCVPTGLFAGLILAAILRGWSMPTPNLDEELFLLQIMPVSLKFSPVALLVLLPIFLVSLTETIGDITATSLVSKQPIKGKEYFVRLRGGVLGDGFNTILASLLGAFPNTTFSQNNAVIRLTGIASRQVGYLLALFLIVLGSIPAV